MAAPKGHKRYGGRSKGSLNALTKVNKEAITAVLEGRIEELGQMIDEVKKTNPAQAFKMTIDLMEFVVSKPKQMDVTTNGETINTPQIIFQDISGKEIK